jgi:hypothetical protein
MGTQILGTAGPYVYPKVITLVYDGNAYKIPRLRFGDIHTVRSRALVHQDIPFAAPEWPQERQFKMTFLVRCQLFRGMMVTALNRVYLWEEFFRAYIGKPMVLINPLTERQYFGVITNMGYSELDYEHVNMELTFDICNEADLAKEVKVVWP